MQKILLWGTGKIADEVLSQCGTLETYDILGIIDNNSEKTGDSFHGYKIVGPDSIRLFSPDAIVVLTDAYHAIKEQIKLNYPEYSDKLHNKNFFYKESILKRYSGASDAESLEVIEFIKKNDLDVFNYSFKEKYENIKPIVYFDGMVGLYYILHSGKKLYFSSEYDNEKAVSDYYKFILLEQDEKSPHRYFDDKFYVDDGDVVIDVGVAEGNFALEIIDRVSKIYLIETDKRWIEALKITFQDYCDKVVIIEAFVSSYDEGKFAKLDTLIDDKVNFIKMDIEGNEWDGLLGAKRLIEKTDKLKLAICCYHGDFDQTLIEKFMDDMNIKHFPSRGFIWFPLTIRQNYVSTRLNRAIVRGEK